MHAWLTRLLGLRLKRSIGFGLMMGTAGGVFWYVIAREAGDALVAAALLIVVASAVAYGTMFSRLPR